MARLARVKISKPPYWNLEWYVKQKQNGKTDAEIAEELYISGSVLEKWKRESNFPIWKYTLSNARPNK